MVYLGKCFSFLSRAQFADLFYWANRIIRHSITLVSYVFLIKVIDGF